ncbi:MAG: C4-dicarboxylic acid transporter DauA [Gammaproteobacteria bacterium]
MSTLVAALRRGYRADDLRADLMAGVTVGVIALPLAMALAIASGVAPQHGLYTAIVAGAVIAVSGGSRYSVAGPTAAFVIILQPISIQFGLGGLLIATFMAGVIQMAMGVARFGKLIEFIPHPVTTGFTAGIAVVIASLQIRDLFGLVLAEPPTHFLERVVALTGAMPSLDPAEFAVGAFTFLVIAIWSRRKSWLPPHLVGIAAGAAAAAVAMRLFDGVDLATIGSRFGEIPRALPKPVLPWNFPGPDGAPLTLSWDLFRALIRPAFAIAMLGAIESLLCAVVADSMGGSKHRPNRELIGQGFGNAVVPFFGGFAATGALARSAANVRAGARSPLSAVFHAAFVLVAVLVFAPVLAWLPMAGLAALLLWVAWSMAERHHFVGILTRAPKSDIAVMLTCFLLTVIFDMVLAVGVGVVLAALLFMQRMSDVTNVRQLITENRDAESVAPTTVPDGVRVYVIAGPLFFGAAERAMGALARVDIGTHAVILDMGAVPAIDATGLVALESTVHRLNRSGIQVVLAEVQPQPLRALAKAGLRERETLTVHATLAAALKR